MGRPSKSTENPTGETTKEDLGFNKEYIEYKVEVTPHIKSTPLGGRIHRYTGERGKKLRDGIRIEQYRAERLNSQWPNRKSIYLEVGDDSQNFELIIDPTLN